MRKTTLLCVPVLLCQLAVMPLVIGPAPQALAAPPPTTSVGDGYATGSGCTWTFPSR